MKSIKNIIILSFIALVASSCFEDRTVLFLDKQVEFESAVMLSRNTGQNFPIINLTRTSGTPAYQVNLIGEQLTEAKDITYTVEQVPTSMLNATTIAAVQGTHFTLSGSSFTFPTGASKADFTGFTVNSGFPAQTGVFALVIVRLDGAGDEIKPSENFRRICLRINLN